MGLYNESLVYAVDTTAAQSGDLTFGQKAGAATAGALVSGLGSIYNTGVAVANALGADAAEIDTYNTLQGFDDNWAEYYKGNKDAIDIAGFIGTSLLPGTLAIKGLNAVRAGEGVGAFGRALGFARTRQSYYLKEAMKELGQEGGSVFTRLNKNKMAAMGWEFADQTLQAAVFEMAVAATMKQSPLLADDSWWEVGKGIFTGAALGGAIGGGLMSLGINKGFKEAVKALDATSMKYTALTGFEKLAMEEGDKAFGLIDSILKLPKEVLESDKVLDITFQLGSGPLKTSANIETALTNVAKQSTKAAMQEFELSLRKLAVGNAAGKFGNPNADVAEPMVKFVLGKYEELSKRGALPSQIREEMGDFLWNLKSVAPATADAKYGAQDLWYFKKALTADEVSKIKTIDDLKDATVSTTPFGKGNQAYVQPYVFKGTAEQLAREKLAIIGREGDNSFPTLKAAWDAGFNIAQQSDGTLRINQGSRLWERVVDPVTSSKRFLNTRLGTLSDDAVLIAADRAVPGTAMRITNATVEIETSKGTVRYNMLKDAVGDGSLDYQTARHAWAAKLKDSDIPQVVDIRDISMMERLKKMDLDAREEAEIVIRNVDGSETNAAFADSALLQHKIDAIRQEFLTGEKDIRALAYKYATNESWIEKLIESEFGAAARSNEIFREGASREIAEFASRENLIADFTRPKQFAELDTFSEKMSWRDKREAIMDQVARVGGQFVTGELAWTYRVQAAVKQTQNAAAAVLGSERIAMLPKLDQDAAKLANSLGAGASFLGSANASYGETLKLAVQDIGKHVHKWINEASDDVVNTLSTPTTKLLENKAAAAELGIVTNILRSDSGKFAELSDEFIAAAKIETKTGNTLFARELTRITDPEKFAEVEAAMIAEGRRTRIEIQNQETMDFLRTSQKLNARVVDQHGTLVRSHGMTSNKDGSVFYAPPIDTNYFQHFAFVRGIEGKAFGTSEVAMIFGRDAAELQKRMALVDRTQFEVITKDGTERYFKAKGQYDFDQTINERTIDSELKRSGALANFLPETRGESIAEDYLRFHQNQATKLIRNAVETNYAQQVAELRALGRSYAEDATSKFSGTLRSSKSEVVNPFDDYVKTMLDVSKRSEYAFFHQANEFVDALGTRAYRVLQEVTGKAQKGLIPYEEANRIAEMHGIKGMYADESAYFTSNAPRDRNLIKEFTARANTLLANLVLRFDFAQSVMNVVSTPLLLSTEMASIRNLVSKDSELAGALNELTRVKVPGQDASIPSTLKLLHKATANWFSDEKTGLLKRYIENGDVKSGAGLYHEAIKDLGLHSNFKVFSDGIERATEKVATLTGNNWAEDFTRFVSADVMRQVTEPLVQKGAMDLATQNAYISTFVNRVQGNYISSQRPVVFQGVIGGAIGLFQTYSFNLLQQLLRHVENKDKRALMTMFGMQAGLFGLNGTPMFDAVNTHIIGNAAVNDGHYDAYSVAPQLVGKDYGDWLMYGTVSAFPAFGDKWPGLYSRGDINPRHMTILPMSIKDIPAVDASIRVVSNLMDTGKKLVGGADVSETLLQGLEHNGLNRPLAGLAQVLAGQSTTSKGSLISAHGDMESIATLSRVAGAKPMDEAIALNNMYRLKAYEAADRERLDALGERVKSHLTKNQVPSQEEFNQFLKDYTAIGGRVQNYNAAMQRWMKDANTSVIEKMRANQNTPYAKRLNEIMGGEPLDDYRGLSAAEETE